VENAKLAAEHSRGRQKAKEAEEALPASKQEMLASLRAKFPDVPIEWGDGQDLGIPSG